jgi:hypothetical protein
MRRRAIRGALGVTGVVLAALAGCGRSPSLNIALLGPHDPHLLDGVDTFVFSAMNSSGDVEVLRRFTNINSALTLGDVPFGAGLVFSLDGLYAGQTPIVSGRTCPVDVLSGDQLPTVSMFVARVSSFAATGAPPAPALVDPFAIVRSDGKVLVAGGNASDTGATSAAANLYNPRTGTWSTAPALASPRTAPALAELPNGDVLIVGGEANGVAVAEVDLFENGAGIRAIDDQPALALTNGAAVTLPQGDALVAGGQSSSGVASAAWRFDGAALTFAGSLVTPRSSHTLSAVGQGGFAAAFAIGGLDGAGMPLGSIELYDPRAAAASAFSIQPVSLTTARARHTATVLATGEILVVGGVGAGNAALDSAEIFDPLHGTVLPAGTLAEARAGQTATLLGDGRVLIAGGRNTGGQPLASAEIYDPAINNFTATQPLSMPRAGQVAALLCDGTVLFVGGGAPGAELYSPRR